MLRRFCALLLALTCALAPALADWAPSTEAAEDCCCGTKCPCPPTDCTVPSAARSIAATSATQTVQRRLAARPSAQVARTVFDAFISLSARDLSHRATPAPEEVEPAARVALFQAHCSLLI